MNALRVRLEAMSPSLYAEASGGSPATPRCVNAVQVDDGRQGGR